MFKVETVGTSIRLNPQGGHLEDVAFTVDGITVRPMHTAPWRTGEHNGGIPEILGSDVAPTLQSLSGDFFCAPFALDDVTGGPEHGPPANGLWSSEAVSELAGGGVKASFALDRKVLGARLVKEITLRPGHPIVYQRHRFIGGSGAISVAHHPMLRIGGGAKITMSKKAFGATPEQPIEVDPRLGRSALAYPQEFESLDRVRLANGQRVDLTNQPGPDGFEDFLLLAEDPGSQLGWTAVVAQSAGFIYFAVRDPATLPFTLLWMSNGGRDYPPFSGRHRGVIGLEEACTFFNAGNIASSQQNWVNNRGYRTALPLNPNGELSVEFAFGAIPMRAGWKAITAVELVGDELVLTEDNGDAYSVNFDRSSMASLSQYTA